MKSKNEIGTTGDLRKWLANLAVGVVHGDVKVNEAAVSIKACKEINASLYSEIKSATIQVQLGRQAQPLGELPLTSA